MATITTLPSGNVQITGADGQHIVLSAEDYADIAAPIVVRERARILATVREFAAQRDSLEQNDMPAFTRNTIPTLIGMIESPAYAAGRRGA